MDDITPAQTLSVSVALPGPVAPAVARLLDAARAEMARNEERDFSLTPGGGLEAVTLLGRLTATTSVADSLLTARWRFDEPLDPRIARAAEDLLRRALETVAEDAREMRWSDSRLGEALMGLAATSAALSVASGAELDDDADAGDALALAVGAGFDNNIVGITRAAAARALEAGWRPDETEFTVSVDFPAPLELTQYLLQRSVELLETEEGSRVFRLGAGTMTSLGYGPDGWIYDETTLLAGPEGHSLVTKTVTTSYTDPLAALDVEQQTVAGLQSIGAAAAELAHLPITAVGEMLDRSAALLDEAGGVAAYRDEVAARSAEMLGLVTPETLNDAAHTVMNRALDARRERGEDLDL